MKSSRPFPTTLSPLAHPADIRWISGGYPPDGFIFFGPCTLLCPGTARINNHRALIDGCLVALAVDGVHGEVVQTVAEGSSCRNTGIKTNTPSAGYPQEPGYPAVCRLQRRYYSSCDAKGVVLGTNSLSLFNELLKFIMHVYPAYSVTPLYTHCYVLLMSVTPEACHASRNPFDLVRQNL